MECKKSVKKVLMLGPDRNMKGGIATVIENYYLARIEKYADVTYLPTVVEGNAIRKMIVAINAFVRFMRVSKHYEIVHIHAASGKSFIRKSFFAYFAYRKGIPFVIHEHGGDFESFYSELSLKNKERVRAIFSMAERVIVLSSKWKEYFGNEICDVSKITIICNGVIIPPKENKEYLLNNILFLGRLCKEKGIYDLIDVMSQVIKDGINSHLFICGNGETKKVKKYIKKLEINEYVSVTGWVSDSEKEKILNKCNILVLPSYYEAMPMAVLEAMSHGYAVIATNIGGIPQIINGKNGLLFDPGNKTELKKLMELLLDNSNLRNNYGCNARKTIEYKFNITKSLDTLCELYNIVTLNKEKGKDKGINLAEVLFLSCSVF